MENKIQLTPDNISQVISEQNPDGLVLLSFYSAENPDCVTQDKILTKLAEDYGQHVVLGVIDCDTQQALAGQLAQQIGLQALPTIVVLKAGAPVDILAGAKTEQEITEALSEHLPSPELMLLEQAKKQLASGNVNEAFSYAKKAYEAASSNSRVILVFADICMQIDKLEDAEALLAQVSEQDQDAYYHNLKAKLEQATQSQDSPELQRLLNEVEAAPESLELRYELAKVQYNLGKKEPALESLFMVLRKDLNFADAKKDYLDIIAALPDGDELASKYRRKLYSLLY
ncbi:tetratricopeptide repeat protein [Pseudoalteromonas sp. T1lg65]|uniref:tetratricopeptide repeat protein n=1 Tax=Pseudoalteromonas sp. T1lg65 TaxID=2077101 RepID=UPI003F7923FC